MKAAVSVVPGSPKPSAAEVFERFRKATPLLVLDHARAGNAFFMSLFDQHPEVLVVPHVGHLLFRLAELFGTRRRIAGAEAAGFLLNKTDFRYVASDMDEEIAREYARLGNDPEFPIDRRRTRQIVTELLQPRESCDRADIVAAMHAAYALSTGRDTSSIRYLLMNDSPLHYRRILRLPIREACRVVEQEFGSLVAIHLVRDPRASFASLRHQFVKEANGMYPFRIRSFLGALKSLVFGSGGWCIFLNILDYTTAGARELDEWRRSDKRFYVVRNEDLNLRFTPTMRDLTEQLGLGWFDGWSQPGYVPTSGGKAWVSRAAYDRAYQEHTREKNTQLDGRSGGVDHQGFRFQIEPYFLDDGPGTVISGPNAYVTQRWKSRLSMREIEFIEAIYYEEMSDLGYQPLFVHGRRLDRVKGLAKALLPFPGEGLCRSWIRGRLQSGPRAGARLAVEILLVAFYYACARLAFFRRYLTGRFRARKHHPAPIAASSLPLCSNRPVGGRR